MMPPGPATHREAPMALQSDENSNTRTTRAKSAILGLTDGQPQARPPQTRKASGYAVTQQSRRQRSALGDLSNVGKPDIVEGKKPVAGRVSLVSKTARPIGVQKNSVRAAASRTALTSKESKKPEPSQRAGSGSGVIGVHKRRVSATVSATSIKEEDASSENELVREKVHTAESEKDPTDSAEAVITKLERNVRRAELPRQPTPRRPPPEVEQLENDDIGDPTMVSEYAHEIFDHLRRLETRSLPNPTYMDFQDGLDWSVRGVLIDWLLEVHVGFRLLPETLFLTINIIDRYLSLKLIHLDRLQLVGVTAMLIASKYEEVMSPHVSAFVHVADEGFNEKDVFQAERNILSALKYNLSYPNPLNFLRRVSKAENYDFQSRSIAKHLLEISLVDHRLMQYPPSQLAAAATYLSRLILERGEWDDVLVYYSGYSEDDLEVVVRLMVDYLARPIIHKFFYEKYSHRKFLKASLITRQWAKMNAEHFGIFDIHRPLDDLPWGGN